MNSMDFYYSDDDREANTLLAIGYSKRLYDEQVTKVKNEEYIKNLLLKDYISKIRAHKSKYDLIATMFNKAQGEIGKKLKKERTNLETIKSFILEDFFNNDEKFKLTKMVSYGYENYAWQITFTGYGKNVFVEIPMVNEIDTKNYEHALHGQFAFGIHESEHCYSVLKSSYEIKVIAKFIEEYFKDIKEK